MKSLINSIILGESSHNYLHQPNHHHDTYFHHKCHSKQNSFSSEIMSTITESSNSSIDSGTFDGFDDPDDHFYDEPLLSSFDYNYLDNENHRNSSSSSSDVTNISSHGSSSVIESLLLRSCKNYKPLENTKHSSCFYKPTSSSSHASTSPITIKKPKIRPPKPPRHINPSTGKKLTKQSVSADLPLTLPPKGVCSLSTSSSFKLSDNSLLKQAICNTSSSLSSPPLLPSSISKKPARPPPPIPNHPPKPSRKKSEIQKLINKEIENKPAMAVLNRSRSSQGPFYETAFDSKSVTHDNLHRGKVSQLSHDRESIKTTYHSNHNFLRSTECNSSDGFITDNINSSRSSTASSTSSSTGHDSSSSSTPKHLDNLVASLLPRRKSIKTSVHIPRSKSSDVTLNLSAAACNSSPPINQIDMIKLLSSESKPSTVKAVNQQSGDQLGKCNQKNIKRVALSTFSMIKSTTSDALSTFDFESGQALTRTRSNLDSLRLSIQDRNNRVNNLTSNTTSNEPKNVFNSINLSMKQSMHHFNQKSVTSKVSDKSTTSRSFCRLNLKLDETRSPDNLSSTKLQSPHTDTRPLDDYDTPWDSNQRLNKVFNKLVNTSSEVDGTDCFLNVNTALVKPTSTTTNEDNSTLTLTPVNLEDAQSTQANENKDEETVVSTGYNTYSRFDKIEQATNQLQLNLQQEGSDGATHNNSNLVNGDSESNNCISRCSSPTKSVKTDQICKPERPRKLSLPLNLKSDNRNNESTARMDLNSNLNSCNPSVASSPTTSTSSNASKLSLGSRKKLMLTFTNQTLPAVSEDIDTSLVLEKQGWYHGSITRLDAESLLRHMKEGSYLIRNCESTKQDYSLSLKSTKGFMHMKIVKQSDGFVLGVFSKPFTSIPEMVKHYSINKLPIRGAEHMSLLYPVIDQLL